MRLHAIAEPQNHELEQRRKNMLYLNRKTMKFRHVSQFELKKSSIMKRRNNRSKWKNLYLFSVHRTASSLTETDDTDSDVLFESQSKSNGVNRGNGLIKNGHKHYATTRLGRRIKA